MSVCVQCYLTYLYENTNEMQSHKKNKMQIKSSFIKIETQYTILIFQLLIMAVMLYQEETKNKEIISLAGNKPN
jgi:cell division septal protein FtsQ